MTENLKPLTNEEVLDVVKWAVAEQTPIEIIGHGSKRKLGRPTQTAYTVDLSGLSGVTLFEPEELILSAKAGTPLADIEALLDEHKQEFQFEPSDLGPVLGEAAGAGTLGGLVSTNLCGPRRLKSGSARDHILGIHAVSGRGEAFKSGGRVVKNVTGYDLSKGVTGAYGTLAVLTDITMKVLPRAETENTLVISGLSDADAMQAMATAMGSNAEVSGAAHLPSDVMGRESQTIFRLEGFAPSVAYRIENLGKILAQHNDQTRLAPSDSQSIWKKVRDCSFFAHNLNRCLWRLSCTPTQGHQIVSELKNSIQAHAFYDWQGGLIWLEMEDDKPHAETVRIALAKHGGGHATLVRANPDVRVSVPVFQPQMTALAALSDRYRLNFDPHGVLNPGRMVALQA